MKKQTALGQTVIYQTGAGAIELRGDLKQETIWASLQQMADLFETDKSGISRHLKNIYLSGELHHSGTVAKIATVQKEGKRQVMREIEYYNLDMILSVGYRVNSLKATKFRQWATKTLRQHIVKGYTVNKKHLAANYAAFLKAVEEVKKLAPSGGQVRAGDALELVKLFADTWLSLDAYDKAAFPKGGATTKQVTMTASDLAAALRELKHELLAKNEATDIFGRERQVGSVEGIIGNVFQSFGGKDLYPSVEEKAAHLLYFIVKNHPFTDGNKRSGAFAFVWFLRRAALLDTARLTPPALTALTLLVAESDPKEKEKMTSLIFMLLKRKRGKE